MRNIFDCRTGTITKAAALPADRGVTGDTPKVTAPELMAALKEAAVITDQEITAARTAFSKKEST